MDYKYLKSIKITQFPTLTDDCNVPDRFAATVAISPTGANVTPQSPRNLQLQAGSGEGRFVSNAQRLLAQAGGENTNLAAGQGRELVVIPGVEHITILFSDSSHQAAVRWLDATFGKSNDSHYRDLTGQRYRDRRMAWYGLHLLGWLIGLAAISPLLTYSPLIATKIAPTRRWAGLIVAPLAATVGLVMLNQRIDLPLQHLPTHPKNEVQELIHLFHVSLQDETQLPL
nr:hypothetical protein [Leptolyngbya sp. NK1-12]